MKQYLLYVLLIGIGIALGLMIGKLDMNPVKNIIPLSCTYKGVTYQDGEGFQDECNSCSCQNGEVMCTAMACDVEIPEAN